MATDPDLDYVISYLLTLSESKVVEALTSVGLDGDYRGPSPGRSRERRIRMALEASRTRGDLSIVLANLLDSSDDRNVARGAETPKQVAWADQGANPNLVFVIHGSDKRRWTEVGWLIDRVGKGELRALVLEQQSSRGMTIIEKFESYAGRVRFAVAVLTRDDVLGNEESGIGRMRASQNAIFELGYFYAKLGRNRVALLAEPGVERLSQLDGVICIELDDGGAWKHLVVREMREAGLPADSNHIS